MVPKEGGYELLAGISNFPSTSPSRLDDANPTGRNDNEQTANQIFQSSLNPHSIISSTKMFMAALGKIFQTFLFMVHSSSKNQISCLCAECLSGCRKRLCQISLLGRLISEPRRSGISLAKVNNLQGLIRQIPLPKLCNHYRDRLKSMHQVA